MKFKYANLVCSYWRNKQQVWITVNYYIFKGENYLIVIAAINLRFTNVICVHSKTI